MELSWLTRLSATALELAGVLTIIGGAVLGALRVVREGLRAEWRTVYHPFRQRLGRSILLGLEFLVGADIVRTVAEQPTLAKAAVLGAIVLIRTFLSFTLVVELEGRWPWQREPERP